MHEYHYCLEHYSQALIPYHGPPSSLKARFTPSTCLSPDLLKLSVIDAALSNVEQPWSWFLKSFFGKPYEILRSEAEMHGLISKGFVNPLAYDYVKEALRSLYLEALEQLIAPFVEPFKEIEYKVSRSENLVALIKSPAKPINVLFYPWPKEPYISYEPENSKGRRHTGDPFRTNP